MSYDVPGKIVFIVFIHGTDIDMYKVRCPTAITDVNYYFEVLPFHAENMQ